MAIPRESKHLRRIAEVAIEVGFQIVDECKYKALSRIPGGFIEELAKERRFSGARAGDNELFPAFGCQDTFDCLSEFSFHILRHAAVLRHGA